MIRYGMVYHRKSVSYVVICNGMAWYGTAWYGTVWYGIVWYGMVRYGIYDRYWCDVVWCGMVWYGMVWYDMVWYGECGMDCSDIVRSGEKFSVVLCSLAPLPSGLTMTTVSLPRNVFYW